VSNGCNAFAPRPPAIHSRAPLTSPPACPWSGAVPEPSVRPRDVVLPPCGILVFESRHAPGFVESSLCDPFSKFLLVVAGKAQVRSAAAIAHLTPRSLLHVASGTRHVYSEDRGAPVTLFALCHRDELIPQDVRGWLRAAPVRHWNLCRAGPGLAQPCEANFRDLLYEQTLKRIGWEGVLHSVLIQLCVRITRFESRRDPASASSPLGRGQESIERVAQYLARIETNFFQPGSLDDAAASTGLSRRRFTTLFRQLAGQSWHQRLDELRIRHAARLLQETDRSVLAIAFESGFETLTSFYRCFNRIMGETPQSCRRRLRAASRAEQGASNGKMPET
jgi:AraC-like DNA-binding protein